MSGKFNIICFAIIGFIFHTVTAGDKPLKVFIMAGQSNMQGKASVRTVERLKYTDDSKAMYHEMMADDGNLLAPKDTYAVYFTAGDMKFGKPRDLVTLQGPLKPGYSQTPEPNTKFGPEYTFGLQIKKHLDQPVLIIKTAWGGRNLLQQFRSPSAGPFEKEKCRHGLPTGAYYKLTVDLVQKVLNDPGKYHPGYSKKAGYEVAGFVWFQGYNDLIARYPDSSYSEYSRLMSCFIRDIRKDLKTPALPFVIGVMGIGGPIENEKDKQFRFRAAQAAPASLPEFKGNVAAVRTENYWDMELKRIQNKLSEAVKKKILAGDPKKGGKSLRKAIASAMKKMGSEFLTPEELNILNNGSSDGGYHYMGSAYTYGKIGQAFADAMTLMLKKK